LLWGPLEEQLSNPEIGTPEPKSICKATHQKSSSPKSIRFSDNIDADDGSSLSLNERCGNDDTARAGGRSGGKIVKAKQGLGFEELGKGVWFTASMMEIWMGKSEACFAERRWRLFGTKIDK
jgi:hypothetical protein